MKLLITLLGSLLVFGSVGCDPYRGKPARLKRPRKKERPADAPGPATSDVQLDEKCRTNFFAPPTKRRNGRVGLQLTRKADKALVAAERKDGAERIESIDSAITTLTSALKRDPYGPLPTYKMAVAYALVGKKGCAIKLLARLTELEKHPDVGREAARTVKRALHDSAFELFRKDADAALGH